jgi:hypothetical protein
MPVRRGMELRDWTKPDRRIETRLALIVDLGRRRDRLLESPTLELPALAALLADYEAAGLHCAAEDLRRRLEWCRSNNM